MRIYDEKDLVKQLALLPPRMLVCFALGAAECLFPCFSRYALATQASLESELLSILDRAWDWLTQGNLTKPEIQQLIDRCLAMTPDEEQAVEVGEPYAEDAGAAVAYVFRTIESSNPQEAAYAARRAYEASYHFASESIDAQLAPDLDDESVDAHPVVQRELSRQYELLRRLQALNSINQEAALALRRQFQMQGAQFFS
jgi:uncharacterized protein YjaG (DUF416 family)